MLKRKASFLGLMAVLVAGFALGSQAIPNWPAPATWSPSSAGGLHTMDLTNPLPFIPVAPCRVADTRGNGFVGAYGPPALAANANRNFTIVGQCGIPNTAAAVSFNFGVLDIGGTGDLRVFPAGGGLPLVSTLNYNAVVANIANAAVVALGTGGAITVRADAVSVDLIIDVNGYYYDYFHGSGSLAAEEQFIIKTTCTGCSGLYGENASPADGSRAIRGFETGATGTVYGVWGETASTTTRASGVLGTDGADVANPTANYSFSTGVIGRGRNGVVGLTSTVSGFGVLGTAENTAGTVTGSGLIGQGGNAFDAIVGGYAGPSPGVTVSPHPSNASVVISSPSLTGNEAGTYFRGTAQTTDREFVIDIPDSFRMVTDPEGLTVQLTPVGAAASMYVVSEDLNSIVVRSSRDVKFHYLVQGVRVGYRDYNPIQNVLEQPTFLPLGPDLLMQSAWPDWIKQRLIANGTYNPDGTLNTQTAERIGLAQMWRDAEEQSRAQAAAKKARETDTKPW